MANAWHLRTDGKAFPVEVHMYPMQDADLASEAEVACFLISSNSQDQDLARYVLDAYMALRIENLDIPYDADAAVINDFIRDALSHLPYRFSYPLPVDQWIKIHEGEGNFTDVDTLYEFCDEVKADLKNTWTEIKDSFNQQFCRVRFGGKLDTVRGNNGIWFRIASVNYNWDNTIYVFAAEMRRKLHIEYINICRDAESDGSTEEYFYTARDGTAYHGMPIDEFFEEVHEKNPVFSATETGAGVIFSLRKELMKGNTIRGAYSLLASEGINCTKDYRPYFLNQELKNRCIEASQWYEELKTRTKMKISKMMNAIKQKFPEILNLDVDYEPRENNKGNPVGFELLCRLTSDHPKIDNRVISIVSTKSLASTMVDSLVLMFSREYTDFKRFSKIEV